MSLKIGVFSQATCSCQKKKEFLASVLQVKTRTLPARRLQTYFSLKHHNVFKKSQLTAQLILLTCFSCRLKLQLNTPPFTEDNACCKGFTNVLMSTLLKAKRGTAYAFYYVCIICHHGIFYTLVYTF